MDLMMHPIAGYDRQLVSTPARPITGERPLVAYRVEETSMRLVPAPAHRDWMAATNQQFAKRCLPLLMANQAGWHLLNDQEVTVEWDGGSDLASLDVRFPGEAPRRQIAVSHFGHGIVTWHVPYLFRSAA